MCFEVRVDTINQLHQSETKIARLLLFVYLYFDLDLSQTDLPYHLHYGH